MQILDATTLAAVTAATTQQAQCEALIAAWAGGNVTVRIYNAGTLLDTLTIAPFTINATTPREVECGANVARTNTATGAPTRVVFRSGSTDIFEMTAGTSGAEINFAGAIKTSCSPKLAGGSAAVAFTADPALPATEAPAWLAGKAAGEWFSLPGTAVADHSTTVGGPCDPGIVNDYCGFVVVEDVYGQVWLVLFGGGHGGSSDNSVLGIRLDVASPALSTLCEPTASGDREEALNGGSFNSAQMWWGAAPNEKPNPHHTRSAGQWIESLGSIIWFGRGGPWNYSGTPPGGNVGLRFLWASKFWAQPGSADDPGTVLGSDASCRDTDGNVYTVGSNTIYKWVPGGANTTFASGSSNGTSLNFNGFCSLAFDPTRSRILRIGDLGAGATPRLITTTGTAVVTTPTLTGDSGVLSSLDAICGNDTPGCAYDPVGDRFLVPCNDGGDFFAIDAGTFAVTRVEPTVDGTMPNPAATLGYFGRWQVVAVGGRRCLFALPAGNANLWVLPLEN